MITAWAGNLTLGILNKMGDNTLSNQTKPYPMTEGLWQTRNGYLKIVRIGKTLVEYKLLRKPDQRAVEARLGTPKAIQAFLRAENAKRIH